MVELFQIAVIVGALYAWIVAIRWAFRADSRARINSRFDKIIKGQK